jgi:hypothetical protein
MLIRSWIESPRSPHVAENLVTGVFKVDRIESQSTAAIGSACKHTWAKTWLFQNCKQRQNASIKYGMLNSLHRPVNQHRRIPHANPSERTGESHTRAVAGTLRRSKKRTHMCFLAHVVVRSLKALNFSKQGTAHTAGKHHVYPGLQCQSQSGGRV